MHHTHIDIVVSHSKVYTPNKQKINIGGDLNLAIWQMLDKSPNLQIANLIFVHTSQQMLVWRCGSM